MYIPCDKHSNDQTQTETNARLCAHCTYLNTELNFFSFLFVVQFRILTYFSIYSAIGMHIRKKGDGNRPCQFKQKSNNSLSVCLFFICVFSPSTNTYSKWIYDIFSTIWTHEKKENEYKNSNMKWIEIWNKVKVCRLSLCICTWIIYGFFMGSN